MPARSRPATSKILTALTIAALTLGLAGSASAKKIQAKPAPPEEQAQTPPAPELPSRQYFAMKGIQPLVPEIEQALQPRDSFKECDICPEMVVVPKGSFIMGTPVSEPQREDGEDAQHKVTLSQPFAVGRFTISFD